MPHSLKVAKVCGLLPASHWPLTLGQALCWDLGAGTTDEGPGPLLAHIVGNILKKKVVQMFLQLFFHLSLKIPYEGSKNTTINSDNSWFTEQLLSASPTMASMCSMFHKQQSIHFSLGAYQVPVREWAIRAPVLLLRNEGSVR